MSLRDKYTKEEWVELEKEVFKKTDEKAYDGINPSIDLPEEAVFPTSLKDWDAVKPKLNVFGKGMAKDTADDKIDPKEYIFAENYSLIEEKIKQVVKQSSIINQMTYKILEKKANGIIPEVAIMSMGDYDEFHKAIPYTHSNENNSNIKTSGVRIAGVTLLIYPTPNIEDGEIEIY
jgi:hypothetical protein